MATNKILGTVLGQSVIHVPPHQIQVNALETKHVSGHLIGELKLVTDKRYVVYVRCPINDGCIVVDSAEPDQQAGVQLYNSLCTRHPFGSKRVLVHTFEKTGTKTRHNYILTSDDPSNFPTMLAQALMKANKTKVENINSKEPLTSDDPQEVME